MTASPDGCSRCLRRSLSPRVCTWRAPTRTHAQPTQAGAADEFYDSHFHLTNDIQEGPDRFLFGTDTVAPAGPEAYDAVFNLWAPIWRLLTPEASRKVRTGNYARIFDEGRRRVRA